MTNRSHPNDSVLCHHETIQDVLQLKFRKEPPKSVGYRGLVHVVTCLTWHDDKWRKGWTTIPTRKTCTVVAGPRCRLTSGLKIAIRLMAGWLLLNGRWPLFAGYFRKGLKYHMNHAEGGKPKIPALNTKSIECWTDESYRYRRDRDD